MRTLYEGLIRVGTWLQPIILLVMRIFWGYAFFLAGYGKFGNIAGVASSFKELSIPLPMLSAYLVATVECVGGLMLLVGLASRLFALLLFITMTVAFFTAHFDAVAQFLDVPSLVTKETPFLYWLIALFVWAFGPGLLSIDALLKRFVFRKRR